MIQGRQYLVWMAGVSMDDIHGTDWHMVTAMARYARILWVDPPVSPITSALRWNVPRKSFRPRTSVVTDQITRLTPVALPGLSRPGVRTTTAPMVRWQTRWALRRLAIEPFGVVATYPGNLLGYWGDNIVDVFYGTDDYVAGAELMGLSASYQLEQEKRIVSRANVVVAVSPQVAERWADLGADTIVVPNGCWPIKVGAYAVPPRLRDLPQPVVGLIGQLSERIDLPILNAIADAGISLLIVGPLDPRWEPRRFRELTDRPNVRYTGPVPAEAVPSYLAAIDVGITPYRDSSFNRASFPLKTLEYLGAGVPAISTDIPAAQWLDTDLAHSEQAPWRDRILALAKDGTGFVEAIRRLAPTSCQLSMDGGFSNYSAQKDIEAGRCRSFAARHTWESRARSLASAIGLPQEVLVQSL